MSSSAEYAAASIPPRLVRRISKPASAGRWDAASEGQPDGVHFYVASDDAQGILDRVTAAGGRVLMPLTEVAPETNIALFADPEGHVIGLM